MKNFIVESGDLITTSGIYRMDEHPGREVTLIYGDAVLNVPGKEDQVSTDPRCQKSQERLRMEQLTMSAPGESRQTTVGKVTRF
jgi:hypothetical protein